ncbi:MAG: sulfatase-like hydrolase/transferase [Saprospiraceae bacterium]|nr:sulfatase-like hydrolase/transferase [Lewinella sp.]
MKNLIHSLCLIPLGLYLFLSCNTTADNKPPNVILIMADDMGAETLGSYGNTVNKTPNLDALAASGILFSNCVSQPLCTPSRVKIMTGRYNYRNYEHFGFLGSDQYTFGNLMQDAGYTTCIAGKWQLNGLAYKEEIKDWADETRPRQFGFEEYCLWQLTKGRNEGERYADPLIEQNGEVLPRNAEAYGPDIFSDFVIDFIERKKDEPFFVYYPMVLVHDPFVPTPDSKEWSEVEKRYENDTIYFGEMVEYTDKIVGKIMTKLRELGIEDETLVIFTGDNGTHPTIYSHTSQGIIQGAKGNTITAGTHVPLIASWGSRIKTPFAYEGLIEFSDFYPTLAALVGREVESDGKSFYKILEGDQDQLTRETAFVHYDPQWGKNVNKYRNQFVRNKEYKLYQDGSFYDLEKDVLETHKIPDDSLTTQEVQVKAQLEKEMARHPKWER